MATAVNGLTNGHAASLEHQSGIQRFADVPRAVDIPVSGGDTEEAVEVDLEFLPEDPTELCTLLENENVAKTYWTTIALAYAKQSKIDLAIDIIDKGLSAHSRGSSNDRLHLYNCLCWLYLLKSREVPRVKSDSRPVPDAKIKDNFLRSATATLNDASRISPSFPPLFLARGVLCLLRAALLQDPVEKSETLRQAAKSFDDAARTSGGKNMMAVLGRARAQYSFGKYADALRSYQQVLSRAPDMTDPDPRIGIGCCFWQLGYKEDAKGAWERALEINPDSKTANILLGLYHLNVSARFSMTDPLFAETYKKAITIYTQKAFKLDDKLPLANATFGSYFLVRKAMEKVEGLARKAIELTDVSAIASDGWYLLARKEHYADDLVKAADFYSRADQARGGDERGYVPAKFGSAQLRVLQSDFDGAKFRLEKIIQQNKNVEAMSLLGALCSRDAFSPQPDTSKEEQAMTVKRAIGLLEAVRNTWRDQTKHITPDTAVLLNLARLYEADSPEKSLQCLQQVQQIEIDEISDESPEDMDETELAAVREQLSPQLLNNIACFHYQAERYSEAREDFQTALNACVKLGDKDQATDTDALVTTISFNLARTYEAEHMLDEAKRVYEGLIARHSDYIDANIRLTYIALRQNPEEGVKAMQNLYESDSSNMEVRALQGWFLRKAKKRTPNLADDQELRHYRHTLQNHDKHDRYALTGMGNLYLGTAREMKRETDQEKERRKRMYERAVEFLDKAVQLDPRNAYAAQGIAIAMIEDKRDFGGALQILTKVRETVKDASVHINLGHVYCEVKQYSRAIESYEAALAKDGGRDASTLACLGRAWLMRGKQEKSPSAMRSSLEYSEAALQAAPEQVHYRFNVAFVQTQIAQLLHALPESQRTLEEVETAAADLDAAIESFSAIARSPNPPFPRNDIEQRANMGRNTIRRQLERAIQNQREYEEKNAERLQKAREQREVDMARRAEEKQKAEEAAAEQRRRIAEERRAMQERDREIAEQRAEEERKLQEEQEPELDEEGNVIEKKKRPKKTGGKRKKQKSDDFIDSDLDGDDADRVRSGVSGSPAAVSESERPHKKKKRKLERKSARQSKYKSDERIIDSDEDLDLGETNGAGEDQAGADLGLASDQDEPMADDSGAEVTSGAAAGRKTRVLDDDDDEDEDGDGGPSTAAAANGAASADDSE